jgi:hypothetical protein
MFFPTPVSTPDTAMEFIVEARTVGISPTELAASKEAVLTKAEGFLSVIVSQGR